MKPIMLAASERLKCVRALRAIIQVMRGGEKVNDEVPKLT